MCLQEKRERERGVSSSRALSKRIAVAVQTFIEKKGATWAVLSDGHGPTNVQHQAPVDTATQERRTFMLRQVALRRGGEVATEVIAVSRLSPCERHGVPLKAKATVRLLELLVEQVDDAGIPLVAARFRCPVRPHQLRPVPLLPARQERLRKRQRRKSDQRMTSGQCMVVALLVAVAGCPYPRYRMRRVVGRRFENGGDGVASHSAMMPAPMATHGDAVHGRQAGRQAANRQRGPATGPAAAAEQYSRHYWRATQTYDLQPVLGK